MFLRLQAFNLPLRHTFTIAHQSRNVQETLIVSLQHGHHGGYGEATANPYYGVTVETMATALEAIRPQIEAWDGENPEAFWAATQPMLAHHSFAHCALDMAAHDLHGKRRDQPLHRLWGLTTDRVPLSNYTIGIDTVDKMVAKMREMPFPIYKIKLGTDDDLAIVRALRQHTDAVFRVDANCAWTAEQTLAYAPELRDLGVEFIEQPLPGPDYADMEAVFAQCALPVMADESCQTEADVARCAGRFHGINIKLTKCGGLTPARRMVAHARTLGLRVMVGCMTESTVGISAIAQLLPLLDYVDMDGALLLSQDIATGASVHQGRVHFPDENGTGVRLLPETTLAPRVIH